MTMTFYSDKKKDNEKTKYRSTMANYDSGMESTRSNKTQRRKPRNLFEKTIDNIQSAKWTSYSKKKEES